MPQNEKLPADQNLPIDYTRPIHGGDCLTACAGNAFDSAALIDFSANIMPFGLSAQVRQAIVDGLDQCCHYPDPYQRELRQALADWHRLSPDQIVCGNGAADVLYRAIQVIKPERVFLPVPTFLEYEKACREQQAQISGYQLPEDQGFAVTDALIDWLKVQKQAGETALLILCNPNNPTGLLIEPDLLDRIIACCRDLNIHLLLDECFLDFVDHPEKFSKISRLLGDDHKILMILNSMTKFYAMPGLRLGYLCAHPSLASKIQAAGQPWPVGTLAEIAGLAALRERRREQPAELVARTKWLDLERNRLAQALAACGWQVWPGQANFLMFRAAGCHNLDKKLLKHHILIRSCANYQGLGPDYYRIAVKTEKENQVLLDILQTGQL